VLGEVLKRQGIPIRVVTGASAGSGNALFTAISSCMAPNDRPTTDPGYRFWRAAGLEDLLQPEKSTPVSMFTAEPGLQELRRLRQVWHDGLPTG
jgi:predicted acylesterase/phospholipase RssA